MSCCHPSLIKIFKNPVTVVKPATVTNLHLTAAGSAPSDEMKGACALPDQTEGASQQGEMQNTSVYMYLLGGHHWR